MRGSEQKQRALYDGIPIPVYTWQRVDEDFVLRDCNDTAKKFTNNKIADLLGKTATELYKDKPEVLKNFQRCFTEKTNIKQEGLFYLRTLCETKYFEITYAFMPPDMVLVFTDDINKRKRVEKKLSASEKKYRLLVEQIPAITYTSAIDAASTTLYVSPQVQDLIGYTQEEYMKNPDIWRTRLHPNDRKRVLAEVNRCQARHKPFKSEYRMITRKGKVKWFRDEAVIVKNDKGQPLFLQGIMFDITKRKYMENKLKESEKKYSTLVEYAQDFVGIIQNGVWKFLNKAGFQVTGYTEKELLGKPFLDFLESEYKELAAQRYELCLASQNVSPLFEMKIQCKDGTSKEVESSSGIIQYKGDPAVMIIARDINERKKMEEEIQKARRLESVGILAGGISHDFNNILTAIIGNISLTKLLYIKSNNEAFKILTEAEKACHRAKNLTKHLLTLSKGGVLIKKPMCISGLLKDSADFVFGHSKVKCEFDLTKDLWPVEIDETQINQVIYNLLINADQAMPESGIVTVKATNVCIEQESNLPLEAGDYINLLIKDQGIGIPQEHLNKIFDPYFTTKQKGSGLGLAISYFIIEKHNGYIAVESEEGVGTTFCLYLPASDEQMAIAQDREISLPELDIAKKKAKHNGQGKILLVNHELIVRDMAKEMLNYIGYHVEVARNSVEVIELYKKSKEPNPPFEAVIIDISSQGEGKENILKLHEIDPKMKLIASTDCPDETIMSDLKRLGYSAVIIKPYEINKLNKLLPAIIAGRSN